MNKGKTYVKNSPVLINASSILYEGGGKTLDKLFDLVYPVGSVYMSINSTSPEILFGGTWVQIKSAFLVGADGDKYVAGTNGGSETHDHFYRVGYRPYYGGLAGDDKDAIMLYDYRTKSWTYGAKDFGMPETNAINKGFTTSYYATDATRYSVGSYTNKISNIPPYYAVYIWYRTA